MQAVSDLNPSQPVINKEWDKELQGEILDSLYMMGKVLTGKANLEGALIQFGDTLPNLQIQEQVIMGLLEPLQEVAVAASE